MKPTHAELAERLCKGLGIKVLEILNENPYEFKFLHADEILSTMKQYLSEERYYQFLYSLTSKYEPKNGASLLAIQSYMVRMLEDCTTGATALLEKAVEFVEEK
jgi:hypothetical protein